MADNINISLTRSALALLLCALLVACGTPDSTADPARQALPATATPAAYPVQQAQQPTPTSAAAYPIAATPAAYPGDSAVPSATSVVDLRNDQQAFQAAEQEVYATLLGCTQGSASRTLIVQQTEMSGTNSTFDIAQVENIAQADREAIADLKAKTSQSYTLDPWIPANGTCVLLSQAQLDALNPSQGDFWNAFHKQYGDEASLHTVSRVGFNRSLDHAIVYASTSIGNLGGQGSIIALVKHQGHWVKQFEAGSWIS